jgi:mannose-6-phosphate isomerase-like protein (cupin superfamily)
MKVSTALSWDSLALHPAERRTWTRVDEGMELSVVARNAKTGATTMFQRIRKTATPQREGLLHVHVVDCQTLVLSGTLEVMLGSKKYTLNPGDYLRVPAGVQHSNAPVTDDVVMFTTTEGDPGIGFVSPVSQEY